MKACVCLFLTAFVFTAYAQQNFTQSQEITHLIESYRNYQRVIDIEEGYRIQISYTPNREEAYQAKARLYKEFENEPVYIDYEAPNYKVKIGDFKNRIQATAVLQEVIKTYPGAFIVKDRIKIR
jgi:hypothetical protein